MEVRLHSMLRGLGFFVSAGFLGIMLLALALASSLIYLAYTNNAIVMRASDAAIAVIYPATQEPEQAELGVRREAPGTFLRPQATLSNSHRLGGMAEGLGCSIPMEGIFGALANKAFYAGANTSRPSDRYHQACVRHDFCYRHGQSTYGYTRADCDHELFEDTTQLCAQIFTEPTREECHRDALKILLAVTVGAGKAFRANQQSSYFEYESGWDRIKPFSVLREVKIDGKAEIVLLQFNRNAVRAYHLSATQKRLEASAWHRGPGNATLVPPQVIAGADPTTMYSSARRQKANTEFDVLQWKFSKEGDRIVINIDRLSMNNQSTFDRDASWSTFVSANGLPSLISISHRAKQGRIGIGVWSATVTPTKAPSPSDSEPFEGAVAMSKSGRLVGLTTSVASVAESALLKERISDMAYRFLQHELLVVPDPYKPQLIAFGRGIPPLVAQRERNQYRQDDEQFLGIWQLQVAPHANASTHPGQWEIASSTFSSMPIQQSVEPLVSTQLVNQQRVLMALEKRPFKQPCRDNSSESLQVPGGRDSVRLLVWNLEANASSAPCEVINTTSGLSPGEVVHPPIVISNPVDANSFWLSTEVKSNDRLVTLTWNVGRFTQEIAKGPPVLKHLRRIECVRTIAPIKATVTPEEHETLQKRERFNLARWEQPKVIARLDASTPKPMLQVLAVANTDKAGKKQASTPDAFSWSIPLDELSGKQSIELGPFANHVTCQGV